MPNYEHPQAGSLVEQAFQLRRLLFAKAVEISSVTGVIVGEVLERIEYMCDEGVSSLEAFVAFDESTPQ